MYTQTPSSLPSMPRPLDINQEQLQHIISNPTDATKLKLVSMGSEKPVLSRANSSVSLIGSGNFTTAEDLENQINIAIDPLKEQVEQLTEQVVGLKKQNKKSNELLKEQSELIEALTKHNEELEHKLALQQRDFDGRLAQLLAEEREATSKATIEIEQRILARLEQQRTGLTTELTTQTDRINSGRAELQRNFNSFKAQIVETEQNHHKEFLTMFNELQASMGSWNKKLEEQEKKQENLQGAINGLSSKLHYHNHGYGYEDDTYGPKFY